MGFLLGQTWGVQQDKCGDFGNQFFLGNEMKSTNE
jgi:hypothetical protein